MSYTSRMFESKSKWSYSIMFHFLKLASFKMKNSIFEHTKANILMFINGKRAQLASNRYRYFRYRVQLPQPLIIQL